MRAGDTHYVYTACISSVNARYVHFHGNGHEARQDRREGSAGSHKSPDLLGSVSRTNTAHKSADLI